MLAISFPFSKKIVVESGKAQHVPARAWLETTLKCNEVFEVVPRLIGDHLATADIRSLDVFKSKAYQVGNWSHRHIAYACGLGTFGLNGALITESGAAHRLVTLVIEADFDEYGHVPDNPFEACLYLTNGTCGVCIERCPAGAIMEDAHDLTLCREQARHKNYEMTGKVYGRNMYGCGLCMVRVPCAARNPSPRRGGYAT